MTRPRTALTCCVLALVATGCGIRPTGVTAGGTAPSGISKDMRIYFASDSGLRGVSRPGKKVRDFNAAYRLLLDGPTPEEQFNGLANLVAPEKWLRVTSHDGSVTISIPHSTADAPQDQSTGQLVCTFARAEVLLHGTRPDKVQVTIVIGGERAGPYQCQQFLSH
ncbi:GerMN domain-containing protein [Streptomyces lydicamycinicus]